MTPQDYEYQDLGPSPFSRDHISNLASDVLLYKALSASEYLPNGAPSRGMIRGAWERSVARGGIASKIPGWASKPTDIFRAPSYFEMRYRQNITDSPERGIVGRMLFGRSYRNVTDAAGNNVRLTKNYTGAKIGATLLGIGNFGLFDDDTQYGFDGLSVSGDTLNLAQTYAFNSLLQNRGLAGIASSLANLSGSETAQYWVKNMSNFAKGTYQSALHAMGLGLSPEQNKFMNFYNSRGGGAGTAEALKRYQKGSALKYITGNINREAYEHIKAGIPGTMAAQSKAEKLTRGGTTNIKQKIRERYNRQRRRGKHIFGGGKKFEKGWGGRILSAPFRMISKNRRINEMAQLILNEQVEKQRGIVSHGTGEANYKRQGRKDMVMIMEKQMGTSRTHATSTTRMVTGAMGMVKMGVASSIIFEGVVNPVYNATKEGFDYAHNKLRELTTTDFGRGFSVDSMAATSERQKAVQAIQSTNMSARAFLGNEAGYLH